MLLQSHQLFDELADYEPTIGAFITFSRQAEPERASAEPCRGVFDYLGGRRVLLYRLGNDLFLEVDGRRLLMACYRVEVNPAEGERILRILAGNSIVFELKYRPPHLSPLFPDDPTAFAEEEDFDFGLFLANVSQDRKRQTRMWS